MLGGENSFEATSDRSVAIVSAEIAKGAMHLFLIAPKRSWKRGLPAHMR
jgi:hypothetical protein